MASDPRDEYAYELDIGAVTPAAVEAIVSRDIDLTPDTLVDDTAPEPAAVLAIARRAGGVDLGDA
jgi:hypothetical protein